MGRSRHRPRKSDGKSGHQKREIPDQINDEGTETDRPFEMLEIQCQECSSQMQNSSTDAERDARVRQDER